MAKKKKKISSEDITALIVEGIRQKKGKEIVTINFKNIQNAITDYFVICHGTSSAQVDAIAQNIPEFVRKKAGIKPWHSEGRTNAEWILLDYVDVVVHIFQENARQFYKIEALWADAEIERLEEEK